MYNADAACDKDKTWLHSTYKLVYMKNSSSVNHCPRTFVRRKCYVVNINHRSKVLPLHDDVSSWLSTTSNFDVVVLPCYPKFLVLVASQCWSAISSLKEIAWNSTTLVNAALCVVICAKSDGILRAGIPLCADKIYPNIGATFDFEDKLLGR